MADYKGIYYKNDNRNKQMFYEGGAHFKYYKLYKILEKLETSQKMRIKRDKLIERRERKMSATNKMKNKSMEKPLEKANKVSKKNDYITYLMIFSQLN